MPELPNQTMRRAAVAMRSLVNDLREDLANNDYWACDNPDATEDEIYAYGTDSGLGGEAGAFAASWTPGVALAVADLLDSWTDVEFSRPDHCPELPGLLRIARAYLGEAADA